MTPIKGIVRDGHVVLEDSIALPNGTRVEVLPVESPTEKIGLDESEWRDDAESLADWGAWIKTIEPPELTPEEEAANARFDEQMRRYNIEAVRRQMAVKEPE